MDRIGAKAALFLTLSLVLVSCNSVEKSKSENGNKKTFGEYLFIYQRVGQSCEGIKGITKLLLIKVTSLVDSTSGREVGPIMFTVLT